MLFRALTNLKQFVSSEFCLHCYGCCRFKEKENVWLPSGIKPIPYQDYFLCPNLDLKTNLCKIYPKRPFDCRLYPFLLNRKGGKIFLSVHLNCPFIEENVKKISFKRYTKYLQNFLSKKETVDFLKREQSILKYPQQKISDLTELPVCRQARYEVNRIKR